MSGICQGCYAAASEQELFVPPSLRLFSTVTGHYVLAKLFNLFIPDRVYAAIVGMNCNVVYALVMLISLLRSGCIVAPAFRSVL